MRVQQKRGHLLVVPLCLLALLWATAAQATRIAYHSFDWVDGGSGGMITVEEEVFNNWGGDFSLYEWRYTIHNISYDPFPGASNGLSGFNLLFPQAIPEMANQYGPAGWGMNCCTGGPPFNAEWDIANIGGFGIAIGGSDVFGFTTAPRYDVITSSSWMHSWVSNSQTSTFSGDISAPGALVPEPGTLLLFGSGLLGLACCGRRRRK